MLVCAWCRLFWAGAVGVVNFWSVYVVVGEMFSAVVPHMVDICCNLSPCSPWKVCFIFYFLGLHGLVLLLFVLLCPLVFQLAWCNVVGKTLLLRMLGILLLRRCEISMLCSACRLGYNTMHQFNLVPSLFVFLVG